MKKSSISRFSTTIFVYNFLWSLKTSILTTKNLLFGPDGPNTLLLYFLTVSQIRYLKIIKFNQQITKKNVLKNIRCSVLKIYLQNIY